MQNDRDPEQLLDHATYLQDELTALKLVIPSVPHSEKPLGQDSIIEMIMMIDHAQTTYYKPLIDRIFSEANPAINGDDDFQATFKPLSESDEPDPDEVIDAVITNRSTLLELLERLPEKEWGRTAQRNGEETTIAELVNEMVEFERRKFKEIAERVLLIDDSRSAPKPPQS
ncbi:MAG: DinB family protein [Balneolales bacterium]